RANLHRRIAQDRAPPIVAPLYRLGSHMGSACRGEPWIPARRVGRLRPWRVHPRVVAHADEKAVDVPEARRLALAGIDSLPVSLPEYARRRVDLHRPDALSGNRDPGAAVAKQTGRLSGNLGVRNPIADACGADYHRNGS